MNSGVQPGEIMVKTGACLLIVLASVTAAGQEPDFSGRWVLAVPVQAGPDIPAVLSVRQSLVRTTMRGEPMKPFFKDITIDRQFETGTRSETHPIGIVGGMMSGVVGTADRATRRTFHRVKWEATSLVFESGSYTDEIPAAGTERREVWSLAPDGRLRIVITSRNSAEGPKVVTLLYRRSR